MNYTFFIILMAVIVLFLNEKQVKNQNYNNYKV